MAAEQLEALFEVLEGGKQVAAENIVQFPVDTAGAAAEGALSGEGVTTAVELGNGVATEASQFTVLEGGASSATTTGLGILGVDVGLAGAAIAPALGILAGVGLYNLTPEFWDNVAAQLEAAGQTVGGKVRAFLNGNNKQAGFSEKTIEIFKNAFLEAGLFSSGKELRPSVDSSISWTGSSLSGSVSASTYNDNIGKILLSDTFYTNAAPGYEIMPQISYNSDIIQPYSITIGKGTSTQQRIACLFKGNYTGGVFQGLRADTGAVWLSSSITAARIITYLTEDYTVMQYDCSLSTHDYSLQLISGDRDMVLAAALSVISGAVGPVQPGAILPDANPFPSKYPEWLPWTAPQGVPWPTELPNIYPVELPVNNPDANQQQAQNPAQDPDPDPLLEWLLNNLNVPQPDAEPEPSPQPEPEPDPDPQPEPEPEPDPTGNENTDPIDPNPEPIPSGVTPVIPPVSGVSATRMFTVYNPTDAEINSLGAFLWTSNIIEQIKKMWEDPMGAIISLHKIYATPVTGSMKNIVLGYIDSGVDALQVTDQFTTIDCGSVTISETKRNATDYTPFTTAQIYLPFVGIVEIDLNEIMNGTVHVVYKVDAYTGTCLALVYVQRSADMPNEQLLYTFSGNASQTLPLTSADFSGAVGALLGLAGAGISVASGGALGIAAGAVTAAHSLTHEMIHVQHSGGLSANSGIMGPRIPYIILSRQHGYDANGYNEMYGYPANKTVYIGNLNGFNKVKSVHFTGNGTDDEKAEIERILKEGFIV